MKIVVGEDGEFVNEKFEKFDLTNDDIIYNKSKQSYRLDFVGFIVKNNEMLAVFPKHFFDDNDRNKDINENVKLLYSTIKKYNDINTKEKEVKKYIGYKDNFESDYPFEPFYNVYEYYMKYGVFKEENEDITLQKSNTLVSNGNLIYLPILSRIKNHKYDFLSECMIFVINHTIEKFSLFLDMVPIVAKKCKINFLANIDYTLNYLYRYKNSFFKDNQKRLVDSLIDFFEQYEKLKKGGAIHFKINYFEDIWEKMINQYLNDYFDYVDVKNKKIIFSEEKNNKFSFFKLKERIDSRFNNKNIIEPDFYFENDSSMYVFDAKYYENLDSIEYKQVAYTLLLGNRKEKGSKEIYSALILPGTKNNGLNLLLKEEYCQLKDGCNYIMEQYMDVKKVMKNYIMHEIKT